MAGSIREPIAQTVIRDGVGYVPIYTREGIIGHAFVDADSVPMVENRRWFTDKVGCVWCHVRNAEGKWSTLKLHRLVTNAPDGMDVDHINHNRWDNRRANLRVCTHAQNMMNHPGFKGRERGVRQMKTGSWHARITASRQEIHLGAFPTKEQAITARRAAEIRIRGQFAPVEVK